MKATDQILGKQNTELSIFDPKRYYVKPARFFRHIVLYLNIALVILLLLSYISVFISPETFWPIAFFGLAYPFLLLLNLITMAFWIVLRRKEFLISLVMILMGWNYMAKIFQVPFHLHRKMAEPEMQDSANGSLQLKVLTYNVRAFNQYNWAKNPDAEREIIDLLSSQKADVICLQEFYTHDKNPFSTTQLFSKLEKTPYRNIYYVEGKDNRNRHGIAIFSAYPIARKGVLIFEENFNLAIYADIVAQHDTFRVYNCHLQSIRLLKKNLDFLDSMKFEYSEKQVGEIKDISVRLKDAYIKRAQQVDMIAMNINRCRHPLIICGDFNDTPISYTYHQLSKNLKDAFMEEGRGFGHTYQSFFPPVRIDYVLHSSRFSCLGFATIRRNYSDHYPLVARFQLNPAN